MDAKTRDDLYNELVSVVAAISDACYAAIAIGCLLVLVAAILYGAMRKTKVRSVLEVASDDSSTVELKRRGRSKSTSSRRR